MNKHIIKLIFLSILLLSSISCSISRNVKIQSATHDHAVVLLNKAIRSHQTGDISQSEDFLFQSLRASESIEDTELKINTYINLSRINRIKHNFQSASKWLDLASKEISKDPVIESELYFEKALVLLSMHLDSDALLLAKKSMIISPNSSKGIRRNLVARIEYICGDISQAEKSATIALVENQSTSLLEEIANSLRLLGTISSNKKDFVTANKYFQDALNIDKQLGVSLKIGIDLRELAELKYKMKDLEQAASYYERSIKVFCASNNYAETSQIFEKLKQLYQQNGKEITTISNYDKIIEFLKPESIQPKISPEIAKPSSNP